MPKIQIRAYGGTGSLILRALYRVMMLDPIPVNAATPIELIHLDLDELSADYRMIDQEQTSYNELKNMHVNGFASSNISLNTINLKQLRDNSVLVPAGIPVDGTFSYSLYDLYGAADADVLSVMQSAFSMDDISDPNRDGCYASLARNSFMANIMMQNAAFVSLNNGLAAGDIVIYVGSTDGGTANTFIEKDAATLRMQCPSVKCYAIRTLVYKKFPNGNHLTAEQYQGKIDNLLMQTLGVLKRMETNKDALTYSSAGVVKNYYMTKHYYSADAQAVQDPNTDYLFDAVFLIGKGYMSSTSDLSQTTDSFYEAGSANDDGQEHSIHITELAAALMITSIISSTPNQQNTWEQSGYVGNSGEDASPLVPHQNALFGFDKLYQNGQGITTSLLTKWKNTVALFTVLRYKVLNNLATLDNIQVRSRALRDVARTQEDANYMYRLFADCPGTVDSMDMIPHIRKFCDRIKGVVDLLDDVAKQMDLTAFGISRTILSDMRCQNGEFYYNNTQLAVANEGQSDFNTLVDNTSHIRTALIGDPDRRNTTQTIDMLYTWSNNYAATDERGSTPAVALIELFDNLIQ